MKYIFVVNPLAGAGGTEERLRAQLDTLPEKDDCEIYVTKAVGDATEFVKKTISEREGEELRFIACGGDGTINEVFSPAVGVENVSVSCWPCGSGNDFVKCYGGMEAFADVAKLIRGKAEKIDVLKVNDRYSVNVTNFGFDTTVAITVNEDRAKTGHGSKSSYTKGIVKALIKSMKNHCKVTVDGELINPDGEYLLCTVANGQYVGGSFKCAPRAKLNDGLMEVCLAKTISRLRVVNLLPPYIKGEHLDREDLSSVIVYRQAKVVELDAPEGFAYSLDGEIIYENKVRIEVVPLALSFAAPQ